jgi:asparagine synthase (glutamine-hydrolysing)
LSGLWGAVDYTQTGGASRWICDTALQHTGSSVVVASGLCALSSASPPLPGDFCSASSLAYPHLALAADVQIHNRGDLVRAIGSDFGPAPVNDGDLLLAAYAKWGERCADFLLGEFAFAIWDGRRQRLFCCRDHLGFRAFLYWRNSTRFIFAGDINPILACSDIPRKLNRRKLAALGVPTAHLTRHEETFHSGILSLPPGMWMTVDRSGVRQERYWEPKLGGGPDVPQRPEEALEALREVLFRAVDCRLDRDYPVAALLSGGLDSSSIVAIAARCLKKQNRRLTAVSAVLPQESKPRFADERDFIDEFRPWSNVDIKYVTARGRGPFDTLHDLSRFDVFPLRSSRFFLNEELETVALASGARRLLWGTGGEFGATSWSTRYYQELAIRLRFPTLLKEFRRRRTAQDSSPFRTLAGQIANTMFPRRRWTPLVILNPDFQGECEDKPALAGRWFTQRRHQVESLRFWIGKHALERGQSVSLIPPSAPLFDKRVLEFCLALPASMNVIDGYQRYLIRGALDGILPPRIQWRTGKTAFAPDYFVRYNAQIGIARDFVAAIGPNDPVRSVIDVSRVASLLKPVDAMTGSDIARDQIPVTLYTINFLRQFSDFRP